MGKRIDLQSALEVILGSKNVYFQPPESILMKYPCVLYNRLSDRPRFASNKLYANKILYKITLVDKNPDSSILEKFYILPLCLFDRHYVAENLNHDVFNIYY